MNKQWNRQLLDGHEHDWSGWAAIWRDGYEICLECGINKLELWNLKRKEQNAQTHTNYP